MSEVSGAARGVGVAVGGVVSKKKLITCRCLSATLASQSRYLPASPLGKFSDLCGAFREHQPVNFNLEPGVSG